MHGRRCDLLTCSFRGVYANTEQNVQNVLFSCIAVGLAGASLAKLTGERKLAEIVQAKCVKMAEAELRKKYHDWWIVPKVETVDKST